MNAKTFICRRYRIQGASDILKDGHRILVKSDARGFKIYQAQKWRLAQLSTNFEDVIPNNSDIDEDIHSINFNSITDSLQKLFRI